MWLATYLLLSLARIQFGAKLTSPAPFDYSLCKERLCFVNDGCSSFAQQSLDEYNPSNHRSVPCKVLLVIWPYTMKKWRVSIQIAQDVDSIGLNVVDNIFAEKAKLILCTKSGDEVSATTKMTGYSIDNVRGSHGADHFYCEFTLETTSSQIMPNVGQKDKLELKYGNSALRRDWDYFSLDLKRYQDLCNPDTIKFDKALAKIGQKLAKIDELTLSCPENSRLMYADNSGIREATIQCAVRETIGNDKKFGYKITPKSGAEIGPLPRDQQFKAHCSQSVCSTCVAVACAGKSCPKFTAADKSKEDSCASLTCDGDRFSIAGSATISKAVCEESGWKIGTKTAVTAAVCAEKVSCQEINPASCDETCSIEANGVYCSDRSKIVSFNGTQLVSVMCNDTIGTWYARYSNSSLSSVSVRDGTNFTCSGQVLPRKAFTWLQHGAAFAVIVIWISGGIALCALCDRLQGLGDDNDNPRMTPGLIALIEREEANEAALEAAQATTQNSRPQQRTNGQAEPPTVA